MKKQIIALSTALVVVFTACEKDEKTAPVPPKAKTKTELLTQKSWDLEKTHVTTKAGSHVIFDQAIPMIGTIEFKADKTGVSKTPEEGTNTFNWELKGDSLIIDGESTYIQKLNETRLELQNDFTEMDSTLGQLNVNMVISLKR